MSLTFIDFFAGIGGFRRGMESAGHKCVGFCEFDKYAVMSYTMMHLATEEQIRYIESIPAPPKKDGNRNLNKRQKEAMKDGYRNGEWYADDITTVDAGSMPCADAWLFGAPCQDFSIAGKRAGLDGGRSVLVRQVFRLVKDTPEKRRPKYLIYENVKGMLSSNNGWDFACIITEMESLGYDVEYQLLNSKNFGVPQNRERVFVIGHLRGRSSGKIFPISGAGGENSLEQLGNFMPTAKRTNPNQGRIYDPLGIAACLNKMDGGGREPYTALPAFCDLTRNAPLTLTENTRCIQARYHKGVTGRPGEISGLAIPVLTPDRAKKRQNGRRFKDSGEPMFTLTSQDRHGVGVGVYDFYNRRFRKDGNIGTLGGNAPTGYPRAGTFGVAAKVYNDDTLRQNGVYVQLSENVTVHAIWYPKYECYIAIRRLTPKECFRLQAWEDEYFHRAELVNSDSQLYKQAGNGITVSVIEAIGMRLE